MLFCLVPQPSTTAIAPDRGRVSPCANEPWIHRILSSTKQPKETCAIFAGTSFLKAVWIWDGSARLTFPFQKLNSPEIALPRWHDLPWGLLISSQQCTHCLSHTELHTERFDSPWICGRPVLAFHRHRVWRDGRCGAWRVTSPPTLRQHYKATITHAIVLVVAVQPPSCCSAGLQIGLQQGEESPVPCGCVPSCCTCEIWEFIWLWSFRDSVIYTIPLFPLHSFLHPHVKSGLNAALCHFSSTCTKLVQTKDFWDLCLFVKYGRNHT